jgi:hypothetical protein
VKKKYFLIILLLTPVFFCICTGSCDSNNLDSDLNDVEKLEIFPPDNPWNTDISEYPVHSNSDNFIASIGLSKGLHPDFGTTWEGVPNGIPFISVTGSQPMVPIFFTLYADESDPGPYPVPDDAPVEGGSDSTGDRHVIVVDTENVMLYELYRAFKIEEGWEAESGAKWDLTSNQVRPKYWTSADAAGLPIFPGLVRYGEILTGEIDHALRFTVGQTQRGFIYPARHFASSSNNPNLPPMGLRLRLKSDFDISGFSETNQIILNALKKFGMFVADNGGDWFISGSPDSRWDDDDLSQLNTIKGKDFQAVYTGAIEY